MGNGSNTHAIEAQARAALAARLDDIRQQSWFSGAPSTEELLEQLERHLAAHCPSPSAPSTIACPEGVITACVAMAACPGSWCNAWLHIASALCCLLFVLSLETDKADDVDAHLSRSTAASIRARLLLSPLRLSVLCPIGAQQRRRTVKYGRSVLAGACQACGRRMRANSGMGPACRAGTHQSHSTGCKASVRRISVLHRRHGMCTSESTGNP